MKVETITNKNRRFIFVTMNETEAKKHIRGMMAQMVNKSPNIDREESKTEDGEFFTITVDPDNVGSNDTHSAIVHEDEELNEVEGFKIGDKVCFREDILEYYKISKPIPTFLKEHFKKTFLISKLIFNKGNDRPLAYLKDNKGGWDCVLIDSIIHFKGKTHRKNIEYKKAILEQVIPEIRNESNAKYLDSLKNNSNNGEKVDEQLS